VQAIVTDSRASKFDIVKHLGVPEDKIHVVYLAGNPEIEEIGPRAVGKAKQDYELPDDYILYVGDINYNKNIPQLIKAVKYLPEKINLVLLGKNFKEQDIPEWQWIKTQIAMSEVADRVTFLPEILGNANQELSAIYTGARAYVQPSLYEGFGLPVLEAMQCKTPVVCAKNSSLLEVGGDHAFYAKPEAESMAEAVEAVLELDTAQRHDWVNQAYEWSQTFSWQKTAKNTLKVYQQILEK
jgi:glycosyltransferase involved in cell wall biosynthesis